MQCHQTSLNTAAAGGPQYLAVKNSPPCVTCHQTARRKRLHFLIALTMVPALASLSIDTTLAPPAYRYLFRLELRRAVAAALALFLSFPLSTEDGRR
jgi:hypothetical protein